MHVSHGASKLNTNRYVDTTKHWMRFALDGRSELDSSVAGARIAALLFTCHPVHVEAVTSIVGRADSLCGLFYFCAVTAYFRAVRQDRWILSAVFTGTTSYVIGSTVL